MSYRDYLNETQGLRVNRGGGFRVDDLDYFQVTNSKDSDHPTQTWGGPWVPHLSQPSSTNRTSSLKEIAFHGFFPLS